MKFIHMTDTHLVDPGQQLYAVDPAKRLAAAVRSICHEHPDAQFVAITGDLVQSGQETQYRALRETLSPLPMPVYLVPGNHDERLAMRRVFPDLAGDRHGYVQYSVDVTDARLLFLDTLEPGHSGGVLCANRLDWLAQELTRSNGRPVHVFMHHPPLAVGLPVMDCMGLAEPERFWNTLAAHGQNVRHIYFGHLHRPVQGMINGIGFSCLPGTHHQVCFDIRMAAGDRVPGCHEPPAYGVVAADAQQTVVHLHKYLDASPRFRLGDREAVDALSLSDLAITLAPDTGPAL